MKSILLAVTSLFLVTGCASTQQQSQTNTAPIKLPSATPFDSNLMARQAYLEAYRDGYRSVLNGTPGNVDMLMGPYKWAQDAGWRAGAAAARATTMPPN